MPAIRRRTEDWRQSLKRIFDRNGAIELAMPRFFANGAGSGSSADKTVRNIIWRVRILDLTPEEIVVEQPSAMGQGIPLDDGLDLVGVISVGQNRWMFHTEKLGDTSVELNQTQRVRAIRLKAPVKVERCQRRSFYRISTVGLVLPQVECWPVLDPRTLAPAEIASRAHLEAMENAQIAGKIGEHGEAPITPVSGDAFQALLMNIGGGGAGLLVEHEESRGLDQSRLFWLCIDLRPQILAPIGVAAKLVHTHRDSERRVYAGLAYELSKNSMHGRFIVERICRYVTAMQRDQLRRRASE